jgi:hypothetical protein
VPDSTFACCFVVLGRTAQLRASVMDKSQNRYQTQITLKFTISILNNFASHLWFPKLQCFYGTRLSIVHREKARDYFTKCLVPSSFFPKRKERKDLKRTRVSRFPPLSTLRLYSIRSSPFSGWKFSNLTSSPCVQTLVITTQNNIKHTSTPTVASLPTETHQRQALQRSINFLRSAAWSSSSFLLRNGESREV